MECDIIACEGVEEMMGVLYLTMPYSVVKVEGEALRVQFPPEEKQKQQGKVVRIPLAKVDQVMVLGDITLTTPALHVLMERRIAIHYFSEYGKSYGSLTADSAKNSGLRLAQYQLFCDEQRRFEVARQCVMGKLHNMRTKLLSYARDNGDIAEELTLDAQEIRGCLQQLARAEPPTMVDDGDRMHGLGVLFGLEGQGSQSYYAAFGKMLKHGWEFSERTKRPPRDPVNALLSFGYTILTYQVVSQICGVGLDPGLGVLHQPGFGKPALALDLVEEFRSPVVDSVVLMLLNKRQMKPDDFDEEFGVYRLKEDARKLFFTALEDRLTEKITHPVFHYKTSYRRCIELQARLFAKYAQGEIEQYVPFKVR